MQADDPTRLLVEVEHLLKTPLLAAIRRSDAALKREQPNREDLEVIRALCARMWSQLSAFRAFSRPLDDLLSAHLAWDEEEHEDTVQALL